MYFTYSDEAVEHLKTKDQILGLAIEEIGHIHRECDTDLYSAVIHKIIGQQISVKAQQTI